MPELPEVETIRRDLAPLLTGRRISELRVLPGGERLLQGAGAEALAMGLVGRRIASVGRRGKYLLLHLDDGLLLVIHLRMTGSLRHRRPDDAADPYLRAVLSLDDGCELRFTDIRKFGTFALVDDVDKAMRAPLGPEPLTDAFTVETMWERLRDRRAPLKSALMDQRVVAGMGNIYADEALFVARLHPRVPAGSLRPAERVALHAAVEQVLRDGIENRGASFRDYTDADGQFGNQQHYVRVFRRTGAPCDVCGATIRRTVVSGRASHWCPTCQPAGQARRGVRSRRPGRS